MIRRSLPELPMPRRPAKRYALALDLGKATVVAGAIALAIGVGVTSKPPAGPTEMTSDRNVVTLQEDTPPGLEPKMARHECSRTGFGANVIPPSALVKVDGRIRHTTFDEGWAVYTGDRPGTLMAVCLDAP